MALVLGLGNPGERYERTRHNVGWRVVEILVARWKASVAESLDAYRSWRAAVAGRDVDLMVPLSLMNRSGEALSAWQGRHELPAGALLVVSDDVYLPVGLVRVRARGSSGGHRGLESIEAALGTAEFARLRIGVGEAEDAELREHVLARPSTDEERVIEESLEHAADAVASWVTDGIVVTMNRFNRKAGKEVSES